MSVLGRASRPPPWVDRDLPRALLRLTRGSLRSARGSLLSTTGTAFRELDTERQH
jgi:hypothetical protein